jgi:hypothetical protein
MKLAQIFVSVLFELTTHIKIKSEINVENATTSFKDNQPHNNN